MIEIKAKVHDKFSIEFKIGFIPDRQVTESNFALNTWIFVPNSLDINPLTYNKSQFYRDVKSNIRLITPIFLLRDIASDSAIPLKNLKNSFQEVASNPNESTIRSYEYQIKMFSAIMKSALRDKIYQIFTTKSLTDDFQYIVKAYIDNIEKTTSRYRELRELINTTTTSDEVINYFHFGDEFISNSIEQHTYRLISFLKKKKLPDGDRLIKDLTTFIRREIDYKTEKGYLVSSKNDSRQNRDLIFRNGILKKYIESDLFLRADQKKDGQLVEQIYLSIAAGLSMIFATAIAFTVQQKYGNFTIPLFVALVISYMLKDRIKELMRYYFAHKLGSKYFDYKTTISVQESPIGWIKEGVDFITDDKVPREVMNIRSRSPLLEAENRTLDEKILLYRKSVFIDSDEVQSNSKYSVTGINDIMRLYLNNFTQKADNPEAALSILEEDDSISIVYGKKVYYVNLVLQLNYENQLEYKRYRIVFNRSGIIELEEFNQ